jgi:hypothetical protein
MLESLLSSEALGRFDHKELADQVLGPATSNSIESFSYVTRERRNFIPYADDHWHKALDDQICILITALA